MDNKTYRINYYKNNINLHGGSLWNSYLPNQGKIYVDTLHKDLLEIIVKKGYDLFSCLIKPLINAIEDANVNNYEHEDNASHIKALRLLDRISEDEINQYPWNNINYISVLKNHFGSEIVKIFLNFFTEEINSSIEDLIKNFKEARETYKEESSKTNYWALKGIEGTISKDYFAMQNKFNTSKENLKEALYDIAENQLVDFIKPKKNEIAINYPEQLKKSFSYNISYYFYRLEFNKDEFLKLYGNNEKKLIDDIIKKKDDNAFIFLTKILLEKKVEHDHELDWINLIKKGVKLNDIKNYYGKKVIKNILDKIAFKIYMDIKKNNYKFDIYLEEFPDKDDLKELIINFLIENEKEKEDFLEIGIDEINFIKFNPHNRLNKMAIKTKFIEYEKEGLDLNGIVKDYNSIISNIKKKKELMPNEDLKLKKIIYHYFDPKYEGIHGIKRNNINFDIKEGSNTLFYLKNLGFDLLEQIKHHLDNYQRRQSEKHNDFIVKLKEIIERLQPIFQPVLQPIPQHQNLPVLQPVPQPVLQPVVQPVPQPVVQPVVQPVPQRVIKIPIVYNN